MKLLRAVPILLLLLSTNMACRTTGPSSTVRSADLGTAASGKALACKFVIPDGSGDNFKVSGVANAQGMSDVRGTYTVGGKATPKTIANAPITQPAALIDIWSKKLADQKPTDRQIRAYEKQNFLIDHSKYTCFNIAGVGPKKEDYLCVDKGLNVAARPVLWVSDFRYAKDLNVMDVAGASCIAAK